MWRAFGVTVVALLVALSAQGAMSVATAVPHLVVTSLQVSDSQVRVGETITLSAIVTNVGEESARNLMLGTTSTSPELETIVQEPALPIDALDPGQSIAFIAVVRFGEKGSFELGVSGIGTNVILGPETKPVLVVDAVGGSGSGDLIVWVSSLVATALVFTLLTVYGIKRWQRHRRSTPRGFFRA